MPVYFVGSERGVHFYAMQFIDGHSLAAVLNELRQQAGLDQAELQPSGSGIAQPPPDGRSSASTAAVAALATDRAARRRDFCRAVA